MPNIAIKLERTGSRNPGSSSQIALHFHESGRFPAISDDDKRDPRHSFC